MTRRRPDDRRHRPRTDAYTRDRRRRGRDASAGWRGEYRHADVPLPTARADGGRYVLPTPGARVRDRDVGGEEGDELLVVATHPDTPAREYSIDALDGASVAEVNPEYSATAPVVEAVYVEEVALLDGDHDLEELRAAVAGGGLTAYSFPADRLALAENGGEGR